MVSGQYVKTFAEATHAIPDSMHMNSDYPFMLPRIVACGGGFVTVQADRGPSRTERCAIKKPRGSARFESFKLSQTSSYEAIFGKRPSTWTFFPFKDEQTPLPTTPAQAEMFGGAT